MNYTTDSPFVGYVYAKGIAQGKRILIYEVRARAISRPLPRHSLRFHALPRCHLPPPSMPFSVRPPP